MTVVVLLALALVGALVVFKAGRMIFGKTDKMVLFCSVVALIVFNYALMLQWGTEKVPFTDAIWIPCLAFLNGEDTSMYNLSCAMLLGTMIFLYCAFVFSVVINTDNVKGGGKK